MTMEDRIKAQLGELSFANAFLATQAEAAQSRVVELTAENAELKAKVASGTKGEATPAASGA